ncbi:MAG TPA: hypothetical protein VK097_09525 [Lentibacillus sp.]|uniref:hypothetical protein n=1 Tax=Lentibacillus sp. TaxID=1925746 RepID=UPI002B4B8A40|nr:hypothetical protein [Lentibacillus sp.]HLR62666.1 hypothetical protein [Lentibacillus sp.]
MPGAQINPMLIQQLTNKNITEIPESPTVSWLPGKYTKLINKDKSKISTRNAENIFMIKCNSCQRKGKYNVGLMVVNSDLKNNVKDAANRIQTTGYFRCKHCNDAGNWEMPPEFKLAPLRLINSENLDEESVTTGKNQIYDGTSHILSSDAETHLLHKLREEPANAFIWNRLGNLYLKGDRPEIAASVFEHSLTLDPKQTESHFTLGHLFMEVGNYEKSAYHFKQMLLYASDYYSMKAEDLREILAAGLQYLFLIHLETDEKIPFLPTRDELESAGKVDDMVQSEKGVDVEIIPENMESFYPFAEMYMGRLRKKLPGRSRTLKIPKQRKSKKRKKKKKK